jgi:5-formyltetrahydrofolate cyclo-ligase
MTRRGAHLRLQSQGNERLTVQVGDTVKFKLRSELRAQRQAIAPGQRKRAALRAARNFCRHDKLWRARRIAAYLTQGSELDTAPLLTALVAAGRRVYVPKALADHSLQLVELGETLRPGRHGIRVPADATSRIPLHKLDVMLLPLLAFDAAGRRLGSGAGYYDRLLARRGSFRRPLVIGYAYAMQGLPELPEEPWDRRLDGVITERGVTWFRNR